MNKFIYLILLNQPIIIINYKKKKNLDLMIINIQNINNLIMSIERDEIQIRLKKNYLSFTRCDTMNIKSILNVKIFHEDNL